MWWIGSTRTLQNYIILTTPGLYALQNRENASIYSILGIKTDTVTDTIVSITVSVMVRVAGLEPTVSWSQTKRDTKLR